jgi:hypothetical protein
MLWCPAVSVRLVFSAVLGWLLEIVIGMLFRFGTRRPRGLSWCPAAGNLGFLGSSMAVASPLRQ